MKGGEGVERVEYRVAHDFEGSDETWELPLADPSSLAEAEHRLAKATNTMGRSNFRIQSRTVTESPWADLGEGEGS